MCIHNATFIVLSSQGVVTVFLWIEHAVAQSLTHTLEEFRKTFGAFGSASMAEQLYKINIHSLERQ
jgi:hypothetical protein